MQRKKRSRKSLIVLLREHIHIILIVRRISILRIVTTESIENIQTWDYFEYRSRKRIFRSSVSDKHYPCAENDTNHNRKEMGRLMLSAFGRTVSEAFSRDICVVCGVRPERFHNDANHREYEKIGRICPACWKQKVFHLTIL
jgi:hypothetical protein